MNFKRKRKGCSYAKRVADVNRIYDTYARTGLSNREIWKRYVYPMYGITEATFYNLLKAASDPRVGSQSELAVQGFLFPELLSPEEEAKNPGFFRKSL